MIDLDHYTDNAVELLTQLIKTKSFSREENQTAEILESFLKVNDIEVQRVKNNVWAYNKFYSKEKKTILLNSHHDTVKPGNGWSHDPYSAERVNNKIVGLGSNDAGASLVSLLITFLHFYPQKLDYNIIFLASAEEEISGKKGVELALKHLPDIQLGIVGEPTSLKMAVAEKGLMVIDGKAVGKSGHAARSEGVNALYIAMEDILKIKNYSFKNKSELLGNTKATVTQVNAGSQHNVVPDICDFVLDVRTNENHSNIEVFKILEDLCECELKARSYRLNSSKINLDHPLIKKGLSLGMSHYGSPTLSDQALMKFDTLKLGPGDSARSHTNDEYIYLSEIKEGIKTYINLLTDFNF